MKKSFVLMIVLGVALLALPPMAQAQPTDDLIIVPVWDNNAVVPVGDSNDTRTIQGVEENNAVVPVGDSNTTTTSQAGEDGVAVTAKDNLNDNQVILQGQGQASLGLPPIDPNAPANGGGGQLGFWNQQAATGSATNNNLSGKFANTGSATDESINVHAKNAAQGDATVQDAGDDAINVKDNQVNLQLGKFNAAPNANQAVTDNSLSDVLAKNVNSNGTQTNTDNSQNGVLGKNVNGTGTQTSTDNSVNVFAKNAAYGLGNIQDVEVEKGGTLVSGNGNAAGNEVEKGGVLQNGIGNIAAEEVEKGGTIVSGAGNFTGNEAEKGGVIAPGDGNIFGNEDSNIGNTVAATDSFKSGKYVQNSGTTNEQKGKVNVNGANSGPIVDASKGGVFQNGTTNWNVGEVEKGGTLIAGDGNVVGNEVEKGGTLAAGSGNIAGNDRSVIGSTFNTAVSVSDSFKAGNAQNSGTINQAEKGGIAGNTGTINLAEKGGMNVAGDVKKGQFVDTSGVNINNEDKSKGLINKSAFEFNYDKSFHNNAKVEAEALGLIGLQNSLQTVTVTELRQVNSAIVIGDFAGNASTMTVGGNNSATNGVVATAYNMAGNAVNNAAQNVVNVTGPTTQTLNPSTAVSVIVDSYNPPSP